MHFSRIALIGMGLIGSSILWADLTSVYVIVVLCVTLAFGLIGLPAIGLWAVLGQNLRRFLGNPRRLRLFNWSVALLLTASLWPVLAA